MKKTNIKANCNSNHSKFKLILAVCIMAVLLTSVLSVFAYADETNPPVSILEDHFSKLSYNHNGVRMYRIPRNVNTCTSVAMSMLLSYYDFYWNDGFVPTVNNGSSSPHEMGWQNGEYNSNTKQVSETFTATSEANHMYNFSEENLAGFAESYKDTYLQACLLDIAYRKTVNDELGIYGGLLDFQVVEVLETYFEERCNFPDGAVTVHIEYAYENTSNLLDGITSTRDTLYNTIKTQINDGNPVIVFGIRLATEQEVNDGEAILGKVGHAMVAYDVVGSGDSEDIILHTGWMDYNKGLTYDDGEDYESRTYKTMEFDMFNSAVWIEIDETKLPHVCTDKYYDVSNGNYVCACQIYETHFNHYNTHYYEDYTIDSMSWKQCSVCGSITDIHYHEIEYINNSDTEHLVRCTDCNYERSDLHNYDIIVTQHQMRLECICGDIVIDHFHDFDYELDDNPTGFHYAFCCYCPYTIMEDHDFSAVSISGTHHQYVCDCGYIEGDAVEHSPTQYKNSTKTKHNIVCECGYIMGTERHSTTTIGVLLAHCTKCGAVFNVGSDIIIKRKEDEIYTE